MTRSVLVLFLCALILGVGLYASVIQADNHARARRLAECQRLCEMIDAGNAQSEARALAHLPAKGSFRSSRPATSPRLQHGWPNSMKNPVPPSASGLRPASAFVVVASVLSLAAVRVGYLNVTAGEFEGFQAQEEVDLAPEYSLIDRTGRPLATFVRRLDLIMSPNAMWQAHTPGIMAREISDALGGEPAPARLLEAMLPDAVYGEIRTDFDLTDHQAA